MSEDKHPKKTREIYAQITWALTQIGEGTYEEIALALRVDKSKVWKRLSEMQRLEMIVKTETRKKLSSGATGYTWKNTLKTSLTVQDRSRNIESIAKTVTQLKML